MARQKSAPKSFLRGSMLDARTVRTSLSFFGALLVMIFLNLILTATFASLSLAWLRVFFCAAHLAVYYAIAWYSGRSRGTAAVALGETAQSRLDAGKEVTEAERRLCWHPLKGLASALIGSLPALAIAVIVALTAQRQSYSPGVLPEWIGGLRSRPDVTEPLAVYTQGVPATSSDILRVAVRALIMPYVALVGSDKFDAVLALDRLSPLLVLLPAVFFGAGYLTGPRSRAVVHDTIREGEQKRKRRELRERRERQRRREHSEPTQLN